MACNGKIKFDYLPGTARNFHYTKGPVDNEHHYQALSAK